MARAIALTLGPEVKETVTFPRVSRHRQLGRAYFLGRKSTRPRINELGSSIDQACVDYVRKRKGPHSRDPLPVKFVRNEIQPRQEPAYSFPQD